MSGDSGSSSSPKDSTKSTFKDYPSTKTSRAGYTDAGTVEKGLSVSAESGVNKKEGPTGTREGNNAEAYNMFANEPTATGDGTTTGGGVTAAPIPTYSEQEAIDKFFGEGGRGSGLVGDYRSLLEKEAQRRGLNPVSFTTDIIDPAMSEFEKALRQRAMDTFGDSFNQSQFDTLAGRIEGKDLMSPDKVMSPFDTRQEGLRNEYLLSLNNAFQDPTLAIGDTIDDDIINQIYQSRFGSAQDYLNRARARGNLNDRGLNAALLGLEEQGTAARSKLSDIGQNIIGGYRTNLGEFQDQARGRAGGFKLGENFSTGDYLDKYNQMLNEYMSGVGGDVRGAVGNMELFDTGQLYRGAGAAQGVTNNRQGAGMLAALQEREDNSRNAQRGLGSRGAF